MPKDVHSQYAQQIRAYSRNHQNYYLSLALALFSFPTNFSHLEGPDRRRLWLLSCQEKYLHVTLHPVENASRGRQNQIAFTTCKLSNIDLLPDNFPG